MADRNPKKKKKKWIISVVIVGILAVLIYFGATAIRESRRAVSDAQIRTATVELGKVELSVAGSGSLTADDSVDMDIPVLLSIDDVQVEIGDVVQAGDVLATLDSAALQSSIAQVQDEIAAIDKKIEEAESETGESGIESPVAGRVKEIAVSEGDSISDVMTQKGYLAVLSLDGKMRVVIESDASPGLGADVTVILPDGSEEDGTVVSSNASAFSVTLTDSGPIPGQAVSLQDEDGHPLGSGMLEINAPLNIVSNSGTVKSVNVELNDKIQQGKALITLSDTVAWQEYRDLIQERIGYEELLRMLLQYAETNAIVADTAGSVTAVPAEQSAASSDISSQVDVGSILGNLPISAPAGSGGLIVDTLTLTPMKNVVTTLPALTAEPGAAGTERPGIAATAIEAAEPQAEPAPAPPAVTELVGVIGVPVTPPALAGTPQETITPGTGYTGTIAWEPAATFFAPQTAYTAVIMLQADPGFRFAGDIQVTVAGAAAIEDLAVSPEAEQNTISFRAVFPPTEALPAGINIEQYINEILQSSLSGVAGSIQSGIAGSIQSGVAGSIQSATSGLGGLGSIGGSVSIDGSSLMGGSGASASATSTSWTTAFTITPGQAYSMVADIDEIDIFSIKTGQNVRIVMDAMLDDVFTGTVTKISTVGASQSGVTTYPVTIHLDPVDTPLLGGMNATANIITQTEEGVPLIPLEALQERGDEQYVYLYDPRRQNQQEALASGQPLGEIRVVTTGISDGVNVEIASGLREGEEIIYSVTESNAFLEAIMTMGGPQNGASAQ